MADPVVTRELVVVVGENANPVVTREMMIVVGENANPVVTRMFMIVVADAKIGGGISAPMLCGN